MVRTTPVVAKTPGLPATGFIHSFTGRFVTSATGSGPEALVPAASPSSLRRGAAPRSPASTRGPHITTPLVGLSARRSTRSVFGSVTEISSPEFQVRVISTYPATCFCATVLSLTRTPKPLPAHDGRRSASVNDLG